MKKMAHIITRLTLGGAQETAYLYYCHYNKKKYEMFFVSGSKENDLGERYVEKLKKDKNFTRLKHMVNNINPFNDVFCFIKIYFLLRNNNIEIVHTHSSKAGILGRLAARLADIPVIVHTVHGWSFHGNMSTLKKWFYILLERFAGRYTNKFIVVTKKDMEKGLIHKIGDIHKYAMIRSGIDFKKFAKFDEAKVQEIKNSCKNKKIIGTVTRLSEQKNPIDFLKIAKKLLQERKDVHFLLVGDGLLKTELEKYIKKHDLANNVTLMGMRNDIHDIMRVFDVFILTSLWEGLPRVIPEAMFCKVPVIANHVDGVGEIIQDGVNGFLSVPHDVDGVCQKIHLLLDDTTLRQTMVQNAFETSFPEFSSKEMVRNMEDLYDSLCMEALGVSLVRKTKG